MGLRTVLISLLVGSVSIAIGGRARAGEGVAEINHACAISTTGCFLGDSGGYPVQINGLAGTSYRLTSDLRLGPPAFDANSVAVVIDGSGITLDLGGFSIVGPCLSCASGGTGHGIDASFAEGTEVRNGRISAMGGTGISIGWRSNIVEVRVESNMGSGIVARDNVRIRDAQAYRNGGSGIVVAESSSVEDSSAWGNGALGIDAQAFASILDDSVNSNGTGGISVGHGALVRGNSVTSNPGIGVLALTGALVEGNVLYANGIGVTPSPGIQAGTGTLIKGNSVRGSGGVGLSLNGQTGYAENIVFDNQGGSVSGGANLGGNYCNPSCP